MKLFSCGNQICRIFLLMLIITPCIGCQRTKSSGIIYYVDAVNGSDSNNGKSRENAWQSLLKASSVKLGPGDKLLLKGGLTHQGFLSFDLLNGTPGDPVIIGSYGEGKATIWSGNHLAIYISNSNYVEVKNIEAAGAGRLDGNTSDGIHFYNVNNGSIDSVIVSGYHFNGINIIGGSNINLTRIYAHNNGMSGIHVNYAGYYGGDRKPVRNLYIAWCRVENNPGCPSITDNHSGNGILVGNVVNGIIEYCEALYNGWDMPRGGNGPVGIWAYNSDSIIIQHCFAFHNMTSETGHDGGGFDFDGGVTNSIMQYNLSAFNEGAGYGMYQYLDAPVWENNILRYNISYLDGKKNGKSGIHVWTDQNNPVGIIRGLHAYNNTIINMAGHGINFEPGHYENFVFENNLILLAGNARQFIGGNFSGAEFNNNLYWSEAPPDRSKPPFRIATDMNMIFGDPLLVLPPDNNFPEELNPGTLKTIQYFMLRKGSLAAGAGKFIANPGNTDFWGNPLLDGNAVNVGAFQGNIE